MNNIEKGEIDLNENEIDDYDMQTSFNINVDSGIIDVSNMEHAHKPQKRITSASVRNT